MKTKKRNVGCEPANSDDFYNQTVREALVEDDEVCPTEEAFMRGYLDTEGSI